MPSVKVEIKQELTLERQTFNAQIKINNTTVDRLISNVAIEVKVTDENSGPVLATTDPNDLNAQFFIHVSVRKGSTISPVRAVSAPRLLPLSTSC